MGGLKNVTVAPTQSAFKLYHLDQSQDLNFLCDPTSLHRHAAAPSNPHRYQPSLRTNNAGLLHSLLGNVLAQLNHQFQKLREILYPHFTMIHEHPAIVTNSYVHNSIKILVEFLQNFFKK